jgi:hypothetical protein
MRVRSILTAALLAGISVACSKPASNTQTPDQSTQTDDRQIRLVDAPSPDAPVVSALEAGLDSRLTQGHSTPQRTGHSRMVAPAAGPEPAAAGPAVEAALPSLALTEMAPAAMLAPTSMVLPAARGSVPGVARGEGSSPAPSGGTRGPVILIRGGMGTADDDCKLHPVASRGMGIAINNVAPPIPGRVAVNNRLPRGNGGFTRIR